MTHHRRIIKSLGKTTRVLGTLMLSTAMLLSDWLAVLPYLKLPRVTQVRAATETFNSSGTWNAPADVCEVTVEAWGGGAGGASASAGGGGGGGGYTRGTVPVTPGVGYAYTVGAQVAAATNGNNSVFTGDGSLTVTANRGLTGSGTSGGAGGTAVTVTGHIEASYAGGAGGNGMATGSGSSRGGGGGGGSATSSANGTNGNNGTGSAGGTGGTGEATGGTGGRGAVNAGPGGAPGAGGGGSGASSSAGTGAAGRIKLTYTTDPGCDSILTVGTTGTQTANLDFPSTNQHVGGAFTLSTNGPTISVTQFVISELGTVNANTNLSNLQLYYKQEVSCSSTIPGDATVFNATGVAFNGSDQATATGSMSVGSSQVCVYVELDIGAGATDGQTLEIQITNPSTQVTVSAGVSAPGTAVAISGTTTLNELTSDVTQSHYRWRNDDNTEALATWAVAEDTELTSVIAESPYRLRFHLANLGVSTSGAQTYQLEVAAASVCSGGTYAPVPTDTSGHWQIVATDNLTDGAATTNVAGGLTDAGTSFVAGEVKDTGNSTGSITLDVDDFTEIEFSLQATTNAIEGGEYCFRLTNVTSYDVYAQATMIKNATGYGFQRKTIKDETNDVFWRFYYDNTDGDLAIDYSSNDGSSWTGVTALGYTSSDFSVWNKHISGTEYVWLAVKSGDDIVLRRGTLGATSITWDSASPVVVAFDGTGASDTYSYPYLTLDSSNYLWVMARHYDGTNYTIEAVRSTNLATSTWTSAAFVFGASTTLSSNQTSTNVYGNLVPLSSQDMYAAFVVDTAIQGCVWDHSLTGWKNSLGDDCMSAGAVAGIKIDDASDFGILPTGSQQLVRTSSGELYTFLNDGGSCEMWTSADGSSWSQVGTTNTCDSGANESVAAAIDGNDEIHVLFPTSNETHYRKFTTSSDTWAAAAVNIVDSTGITVSNSTVQGIVVDSNNVPHAAYYSDISSPSIQRRQYYRNRVGGTWNTQITIKGEANFDSQSTLIINNDNAPEFFYRHAQTFNPTMHLLSAGTTNNPTSISSFTEYDTGINVGSTLDAGILLSGAMDASDNTWITYVTSTGTIGLFKHAAGTAWDNGANWTNITSKTDVGDEPSIAVHGTDVYVFYTNDTDDIAYDIYNGSSWAGEVVLETGTYQDAKVKWSNYFNNGSDGLDYGGGASGIPELDYLFSDGTDVWYGRLASSSSPDEIATTVADLSKHISAVSDLNNYDVHIAYVADSATDYIAYKRYDTGTSTWDASAVSLAASDTNAYPNLTVDATSHDLTVLYLDTSSGNISYRQCDVSGATSQCSVSGDWATAVEWQTGEATALSSNYSTSGEVFALWSDTGAGLSIEWDLIIMAALVELIQNDFRWYVSEDTLTLSNPWPDGPGGNLLENEVLTQLPASNRPPRAGDKLRLKINLTISGAALSADTQAFKLQYAAASQCSSAVGWTDVGAKASGGVWRFYDQGTITDQSTAVNSLTTSDTGAEGRYSEANPTSTNPGAVSIGQNSEWDWAIEHNTATSNSSYCFRMVKADDSPLDTYNPDSYPRLVTAPGTESLMRHGNFFQGETNQGFFWAE